MARRLRIHVSDGLYPAMSGANGGGVAGVVLGEEEEAWPPVRGAAQNGRGPGGAHMRRWPGNVVKHQRLTVLP
jgi:hypothetical protein